MIQLMQILFIFAIRARVIEMSILIIHISWNVLIL